VEGFFEPDAQEKKSRKEVKSDMNDAQARGDIILTATSNKRQRILLVDQNKGNIRFALTRKREKPKMPRGGRPVDSLTRSRKVTGIFQIGGARGKTLGSEHRKVKGEKYSPRLEGRKKRKDKDEARTKTDTEMKDRVPQSSQKTAEVTGTGKVSRPETEGKDVAALLLQIARKKGEKKTVQGQTNKPSSLPNHNNRGERLGGGADLSEGEQESKGEIEKWKLVTNNRARERQKKLA